MPRLAFLGPALGRHPGWVTTQGEVLAGLFASQGHPVVVSSGHRHPVARAVHHAATLVRHRRDVDVAVVSVFSGRAFALAEEALLLSRALGIPRVAWLHGGNLPDWSVNRERRVRRVLGAADAVVAPSGYLARWARAHGADVRVIPNVLDLEGYHFRARPSLRPRLLWMRTFQELYAPDVAVRVLAGLRSHGVDARLTMAGQDKGSLGATRDLAERLGVAGWIDFPGFVSGAAKARLLDDHDIFLNTNLVDNAPVTVLEAAASGLVVVSTAVGGMPDLLPDGLAASLVPPADPDAMVDAVQRLLADPTTAASLADAARSVAVRSAWPSVRQEWLDLTAEVRAPGRDVGGPAITEDRPG